VTEKEEQVSIMADIYHEAAKVLLWVGEEVDHGATQALFALFRAVVILQERHPSKYKKFQHLYEHFVLDYPGAIQLFMSRSWFYRRWVWQEAYQNNTTIMVCGQERIPWRTFTTALLTWARIWEHQGPDPDRPGVRLIDALGRTERDVVDILHFMDDKDSDGHNSILSLIWNLHLPVCLDPRDRVIALIGLMPRENRRFHADMIEYRSHWTSLYYHVVIFPTAWFNLRTFQHLQAFGTLAQLDENMPSWVPNWNKPREWNSRYFDTYTFGNSGALHSFSMPTYGTLNLTSPRLGKITFTQRYMRGPGKRPDSTIRFFVADVLALHGPIATESGENFDDILYSWMLGMLVCAIIDVQQHVENPLVLEQSFWPSSAYAYLPLEKVFENKPPDYFVETLKKWRYGITRPIAIASPTVYPEYFSYIESVLERHVLFSFQCPGRRMPAVGIGPASTTVGDHIIPHPSSEDCTFQTGILLRPTASSTGAAPTPPVFRIKGLCWMADGGVDDSLPGVPITIV
jgi:hypothetical protein